MAAVQEQVSKRPCELWTRGCELDDVEITEISHNCRLWQGRPGRVHATYLMGTSQVRAYARDHDY